MILEQLRERTRDAHEQLEAEVRIEASIASRERYRTLLQKFLGFYGPIEDKLAAILGTAPDGYNARERRQTPWLKADLQSLGMTSQEIAELPVCENLPALDTTAHAIGCAYVIEGSTLGGKQISKLIEAASADLPHQFFSAYGPEVGARWRDFCNTLEKFAEANPKSVPETLSSAEQTFRCFHQWIRS